MKKEISWIFALIFTVYFSLVQLIMSSRFPLDSVVNTGKQKFHVKLLRSFTGDDVCPFILPIEDISVSGYILYHLKTDSLNDKRIDFKREGDKLIGYFPKLSPSSILVYRIFLERENVPIPVNEGKPVLLNYKGKVPLYLLILNGLLVIMVILSCNLTGFFAAFGVRSFKWMNYLTISSLLLLGFFIHPLVQKYSLNTLWPGDWNFNSKILLLLVTWSIALILSGRKNYRIWPVLAFCISIVIFLIPHQIPGEGETVKISLNVLEKNLIALLQLF